MGREGMKFFFPLWEGKEGSGRFNPRGKKGEGEGDYHLIVLSGLGSKVSPGKENFRNG